MKMGNAREVIDAFKHSGLVFLEKGKSVLYIGIDVGKEEEEFGSSMSRITFISSTLQTIGGEDMCDVRGRMVEISRRKQICRKSAGGLLRAIQTRLDFSHRIRN